MSHIIDSLTPNPQTQGCNSGLNKACYTHIFLPTAHPSLPELRNASQRFSTMLGGCFKQWNPNKRHRMWKTWFYLGHKRVVCSVWELNQEDSIPCSVSAGNKCTGQLQCFSALCMSSDACESMVTVDVVVTKKSQVGKCADMGSANNEHRLHSGFGKTSVLVHAGCYNNMSCIGWLKQQTGISHSSKSKESLRSRNQTNLVSGESCILVHRWPSFHCNLTW